MYYSPDSGVVTAVARCTTLDELDARAMLNGVELLTCVPYCPDLPANLGVWAGTYFPGSVPLRIPELVSTPGTLHSMWVYTHYPASFRDGLLFLGENVMLCPRGITEIALAR